MTAIMQAVDSKRAGWNGIPISTARIYAELWPLIMNEDWCLASLATSRAGHHTFNFGITTSRTAIWEAKVREAWATAHRHRWERRWPRKPAIESS